MTLFFLKWSSLVINFDWTYSVWLSDDLLSISGDKYVRFLGIWFSDSHCIYVHFITGIFSIRPRCLIHNAHLGKILSFCKTLDLKITHLKEMFDYNFHLIFIILFLAWPSKVKTTILYHKIVCTVNIKTGHSNTGTIQF
jgi:hypothetical protein